MDTVILARVYALVAQMNSIVVEVEGMKALNAERLVEVYAPGHPMEDFFRLSSDLRGIADELNILGRG